MSVTSVQAVPPRLKIWSTQSSVRDSVPSVTAIIESIAAGVLYWVIAVRFETYLLLFSSIPAALLLLLRSDESVDLGVKWFTKWETIRWRDHQYADRIEREQRDRRLFIVVIALLAAVFSILFGGYVSFRLAQYIIAGAPPETTFWRGLVTGMSGFAGAILITGMLGGQGFLVRGSVALFWGAGIASAAVLATVIVSAAGAVAAAALAFTGILSQAGAERVAEEGSIIVLMFLGLFLTIWLGIALGVFLISLGIRVGATARYILLGIKSLPKNFRRLIFCTSPIHLPELVPGLIRGQTDFTLHDVWQRFNADRRSTNFPVMISALLFYPFAALIWFAPAWIYRLILKSTVWFWYPLAYLGSDLSRADNPGEFRRAIMGSLWAWTSVVIALGTIAVFIVRNLVWTGVVFETNPFLSVFGYFAIADWSSLRVWQALSILMAVTTIIIVYWMDIASGKYRIASAQPENQALLRKANSALGWVERLARLRFVMFVFFQILVAIQVLLIFNSEHCWLKTELPTNVVRWLERIYGQKVPQQECKTGVSFFF